MDITERATELHVKRAPPCIQSGGTFQCSVVLIECTDDVIPALHAVRKDTRTARGSHNIYAYRLLNGHTISSTMMTVTMVPDGIY